MNTPISGKSLSQLSPQSNSAPSSLTGTPSSAQQPTASPGPSYAQTSPQPGQGQAAYPPHSAPVLGDVSPPIPLIHASAPPSQPGQGQDENGTGKDAERMPNLTGIPLSLKRHFETLSGFSLDDVRVHYNSSKPQKFQAQAYTQGDQIYVSQGQERHLAHELGHVIQQKRGIVSPTGTQHGELVNEDPGLEKDADQFLASSASTGELKKVSASQNVIQKQVVGEFCNSYFKDFVLKNLLPPPIPNSPLYNAKISIDGQYPVAFIVNAMLSYRNVEAIEQNILAMVNGLNMGINRISVVLDMDRQHKIEQKN